MGHSYGAPMLTGGGEGGDELRPSARIDREINAGAGPKDVMSSLLAVRNDASRKRLAAGLNVGGLGL